MSYIGAYNFTPRDLPAGYTQVEYLQSTGTQYIDTGFKPNQDTRILAETYCPLNSKSFCGVYDSNTKRYGVYVGSNYRNDYNTTKLNGSTTNITQKFVIDKNKNVQTVNGISSTVEYAQFQLTEPLHIFAYNDRGTATYLGAGIKLYSFKIYDNGTPVRDFVPCLKGDTPGLFDLVNGVFYADSSGAGGFVVGPTCGSFARRIKQIFVGVDTDVPIYGDEVRTVAVTASNIKELFDVTNGSYYFAGSGGTFTSNNGGKKSTTASTILTAKMDMDVSFTYSYSSEKSYDVFTLKVGGTTVENEVSGAETTKTYSGKLKTGQTIEFSYKKDSSTDSYNDKCTFSGMSVTATFRTQVGVETRPVARKVKKAYIGVANEAVYGGTATLCYQAVD